MHSQSSSDSMISLFHLGYLPSQPFRLITKLLSLGPFGPHCMSVVML